MVAWFNVNMGKISKFLKENFSFWALSAFWLFALLNPVFKKYDYGAEYPLVLVFGVLLLILAIVEFKKKQERGVAMNLERIFLLIFGLFVALSFVFSQTKNLGFSEVLVFLEMAGFYLIFGGQKIKWSENFLKIVKTGAVLSVIFGFILYFWREEVRMVGPFFNILYHANVWPNAFALFLIMAWPLFIPSKKEKKRSLHVWKFLILSFVLSALLLTFSRGAVLVFAGQIFLLVVYFFFRIKKIQVLSAILVGLAMIGIFYGTNYLRSFEHQVINIEERVTFSNSEGLTSQKERLDFWKGAIELAGEKPIFGWGPFSFRYAYNGIQKDLLANADHPHNIFLKIAVENGLVALAGFCGFLLSIFAVAIRRFKKLTQAKKDLVFVLFLGIAGAFAHSLIDYNFNFLANFLLLFVFLIIIRSLVSQNEERGNILMKIIGLVLSLVITVVFIFEGTLLVLDKTTPDSAYLSQSLYSRNFYLGQAEKFLKAGNFEKALKVADRQIALNSLDSQAFHLKGVVYCNQKYEKNNPDDCTYYLAKAIELNGKNDLSYYVDYFRALADRKLYDSYNEISGFSVNDIVNQTLDLLETYFKYVENNVHFTAYTPNVEAAAELVDILSKGFDLDKKTVKELRAKKEKMLKTAKKLRAEKRF